MNSEKVKEIKKALKFCCGECDCDCPFYKNGKSYEECKSLLLFEALTLINELEECSEKWQKLCADEVALNTPLKERIKELEALCNKTYEDLTKEIDRLENRVKELEDGIAKSMLGCEFLPECTKEKEKEVVEKFIKAVYKELYELGKIYALPETLDADKYGIFSITQEVIAKIAKEQFSAEIKDNNNER